MCIFLCIFYFIVCILLCVFYFIVCILLCVFYYIFIYSFLERIFFSISHHVHSLVFRIISFHDYHNDEILLLPIHRRQEVFIFAFQISTPSLFSCTAFP